MDVAAKVTSKGQVTVPKAVREALGIKEGDEIVFRVDSRSGGKAERGLGRRASTYTL
jgi:AbrB family looped-hinge helix DNA binding protein